MVMLLISDKLLNNIEDVEGLHQLVMWHPNTKLEEELTQEEIDDVVQLQVSALLKCDLVYKYRSTYISRIQRFLLSVTAKDVSLLLTFREIFNGSEDDDDLPALRFESVSSVGGRAYRVMISVIDLDPKPVHRIPTWVKRKEDWLDAYFESFTGGRERKENQVFMHTYL